MLGNEVFSASHMVKMGHEIIDRETRSVGVGDRLIEFTTTSVNGELVAHFYQGQVYQLIGLRVGIGQSHSGDANTADDDCEPVVHVM